MFDQPTTVRFRQKLFVLSALLILSASYANYSETPSNKIYAEVYQNVFLLDGKVAEWQRAVNKMEEVKTVINKYICPPKKKCVIPYSEAYNKLSDEFSSLKSFKDNETSNCIDLYGSDDDCPNMHIATDILEDLVKSIDGKKDSKGNLSDRGKQLLKVHFDRFIKHQDNLRANLNQRLG